MNCQFYSPSLFLIYSKLNQNLRVVHVTSWPKGSEFCSWSNPLHVSTHVWAWTAFSQSPQYAWAQWSWAALPLMPMRLTPQHDSWFLSTKSPTHNRAVVHVIQPSRPLIPAAFHLYAAFAQSWVWTASVSCCQSWKQQQRARGCRRAPWISWNVKV